MRFLVVGLGSIGYRHARNLSAFGEVGLVDVDVEKCSSIANDLKSANFGNSIEAALDWGFDGVVIATNPDTHISIANRIVDSRAHILIEKPISNNVESAKKFLANQEVSSRTYVVCNMRFHPGVQALKKNLEIVGVPLFAHAQFGSYLPSQRKHIDYKYTYAVSATMGGVSYDAVHEIDYLRWLLGPIRNVTGSVHKLSQLEIQADDYAHFVLEHSTGVRSEVYMDFLRHGKKRSCEIVGNNGTLSWISEGKSPELCEVKCWTIDGDSSVVHFDQNLDSNQPYFELVRSFVAAISGELSDLQTGEDGLSALESVCHVKHL